ncbi:MAG: AsmA family protein [candidate division Zixibacteria bacterium]|nr:AsmA family protein [candidate division Zixibacteria bacterium]
MKKFLIIFTIIIVLILAALVSIPLLFKGQIIEFVKEQASQNVNAAVDFDDVGLNLFSNFPKLTMSVDNITVVNREPFEGDTLFSLDEFQAALDLKSLVFGGEINIISILIDKPQINIGVLEDGRASYDIVPKTPEETAEIDTSETMISLAIQKYEIRDACLSYTNDSTNMYVEVDGLNHEGNGDFAQSLFTLYTQTSIASLTLKMEGTPYLNKADMEIKANIEMDLDNMKYTFKENEVRLNRLFLNFDGWVAMLDTAGEELELDLTFNAPKAEFKNILSMVPYIYTQDFEGLKAEGQLSLNGEIKGVYNENQVPFFEINLNVANGMFQYPDLPTPVEQVNVDLQIRNPGKTLDHTIIDLKKFHLAILKEPVDFQVLVKTPMSDPYINAHFSGNINLGEALNIFPMEDITELKGLIRSNFRFKGNISDIENNRFRRITAAGSITLADILYAAPDLPVKIQIPGGDLNISTQKASLKNFKILMGKSDISAYGELNNILGFGFEDQTLKGSLTIKSNYFDIDPWMTGEEKVEEDTIVYDAVPLPDKVEFTANASFNKVHYDNLDLTAVKGKLILKNRILKMIGLSANLVKGSMIANGSYKYIPPEAPHVSFDMDISKFDIPEMFKTFATVEKLVPVADNMTGTVSGKLDMHTDLGDSLMPELMTLRSQGTLDIPRASLENYKPMIKAAEILKNEKLRNPTIKNFKPSYEIKDGRFYLKPTTFKVNDYKVTASGSNGLDMTMDYKLDIEMPASDISAMVNQDLSMLAGNTITIEMFAAGTNTNPKVRVSLDKVKKAVAEQVKKIVKKEADKKKKELEDKAKRELEKKKKQEEAKLKKELDKKKKKEEDKLKKKLKGLFK